MQPLYALGRIALALLNTRTVRAVAVAFTVTMTVYWIYERRPFRAPEPVVPESIQQAQSRKHCLGVIAGDDGITSIQQLFVVHAAMNAADQMGLSLCKIHELKVTLLAPSEQGTGHPRYPGAAEALDNAPIVGDPENASRGRELATRVMKSSERRADYQRYACLAHVIAYYRVTKTEWFWFTPQDKAKMGRELEPLFTDSLGFIAYGPKGTQVKCQ